MLSFNIDLLSLKCDVMIWYDTNTDDLLFFICFILEISSNHSPHLFPRTLRKSSVSNPCHVKNNMNFKLRQVLLKFSIMISFLNFFIYFFSSRSSMANTTSTKRIIPRWILGLLGFSSLAAAVVSVAIYIYKRNTGPTKKHLPQSEDDSTSTSNSASTSQVIYNIDTYYLEYRYLFCLFLCNSYL